MNPSSIRLPGMGAVPTIGATAQRGAPAPTRSESDFVIDVTEASFQAEVIERSMVVPVVVDFWADWCGPCKQLSPVLERLAAEGAGAWILAKIDVDANPRLAQAAQVQGIPAVKAIVKGQVVDLFTGAMPEKDVRQVLTQLLALAAEQGMVSAESQADPGPVAPQLDPDLERGDEALAQGDLDGAQAAYAALLEREPGNAEAKSSIARVGLVRRASAVDPAELEKAVQADPASLDNLLALADLFVLSDRVDAAFDLLVDAVRRSDGADRDRVRTHLLDLFLAVGDGDERVAAGRRNLTNALF